MDVSIRTEEICRKSLAQRHMSDHQKQHVLQRHTNLIYRLKYVGTYDTETTEGENYQIAFPQVTSRLNSRGKIRLSEIRRRCCILMSYGILS